MAEAGSVAEMDSAPDNYMRQRPEAHLEDNGEGEACTSAEADSALEAGSVAEAGLSAEAGSAAGAGSVAEMDSAGEAGGGLGGGGELGGGGGLGDGGGLGGRDGSIDVDKAVAVLVDLKQSADDAQPMDIITREIQVCGQPMPPPTLPPTPPTQEHCHPSAISPTIMASPCLVVVADMESRYCIGPSTGACTASGAHLFRRDWRLCDAISPAAHLELPPHGVC